jgi:phage terminase small subunit
MSLDVPIQANEDAPQALSVKQEQLIAALLAGANIQVAASTAGVNEKTADRWLKLPHVQQALKDAQRALFDESLNSLMLGASEAVNTLTALMKDSEVPPGNRIRAAQIVLEQAIELHKMSELEARLAELEQLVKVRVL